MKEDYTGKKFGHWTVLSYSHTTKSGHRCYECQCDCGTIKVVRLSKLVHAESLSCGCKRREKFMFGATSNGKRTKLYNTWLAMKERCNNPSSISYKNYGAKGIYVCGEWNKFGAFKKWAEENGYAEGLSIDRIDLNKGYSPNNCRWATAIQQANNTRKNKYVKISGSYKTLSEAARELGIKYTTFYYLTKTANGRKKIASNFKNCKANDLIPCGRESINI
jgi:hypothetical protein